MKTYTPGYVGTKAALFASGLVLLAVSIGSLWDPLRLIFTGQSAQAEVSAMLVDRAEEPTRTTRTKGEALAEIAKGADRYRFLVRLSKDNSSSSERELNLQYKAHPTLQIGDSVFVYFDITGNGKAIAFYDLSTWTFGLFLTSVGLFLCAVNGLLLWNARTPIELSHPTTDTNPNNLTGSHA
jgi:hypothetical protein